MGTEYKKSPLILLHGGPGSTHNSFELLDELSDIDERPIIMYDQLGSGKSYIGDNHKELWNKDTWIKELENIISYLNIKECHILGHSWGGMLLIMYLTDTKREGIKSCILSSTLSSASLWGSEAKRLITYMSAKDQKIINNAINSNDYSSKEFKRSMMNYYHLYVWPKFDKNSPKCLTRKKRKCPEVYETTWGPSEFIPLGNLKDYDYTLKLKNIDVPVLILSGANDESTPLQNKIMYDNIVSPKEWYLFQNSRHMTYFEEKDNYIKVLKEFIDKHD